MNKKIMITAIVLLGTMAFFLLRDKNSHNDHEIENQVDSHDHSSQEKGTNSDLEQRASSEEPSPVQLSKAVEGIIEKKPFVPQTKEEESMHKMNQRLQLVFNHREEPRELISFFEEEALAPEMSTSSNEYTGTMQMIRTQKSMPGARYFHAQYVGDNPENTFLQHFSYEFQPGENSFKRMIQSAEGTFELANKKIHRNGDFVTYDIGKDGMYELSIEKANWESLKGDPYNAHTKEDVGTIITRIELKIHDDDDDHGHDHSTHIDP